MKARIKKWEAWVADLRRAARSEKSIEFPFAEPAALQLENGSLKVPAGIYPGKLLLEHVEYSEDPYDDALAAIIRVEATLTMPDGETYRSESFASLHTLCGVRCFGAESADSDAPAVLDVWSSLNSAAQQNVEGRCLLSPVEMGDDDGCCYELRTPSGFWLVNCSNMGWHAAIFLNPDCREVLVRLDHLCGYPSLGEEDGVHVYNEDEVEETTELPPLVFRIPTYRLLPLNGSTIHFEDGDAAWEAFSMGEDDDDATAKTAIVWAQV